jgi:predicted GTPase
LVIDANIGPTMQDKRIAGKILDSHRACAVLCQKWDLAQK